MKACPKCGLPLRKAHACPSTTILPAAERCAWLSFALGAACSYVRQGKPWDEELAQIVTNAMGPR